MSHDRVKCALSTTAVPADRTTHPLMIAQIRCLIHQYVFSSPLVKFDERCPIGRLEDIEARLDSIEDALHAVTKALSERS